MSTSGAMTGWLRDLVGYPTLEVLVAAAGDAPAGPAGLVVLPYFAGERTPVYDPNARRPILTLAPGRAELYGALLAVPRHRR